MTRTMKTVNPQSLEVSKIKKNKKNFEKFWSSIINFSKFFLFLKLQVTVVNLIRKILTVVHPTLVWNAVN